MIINLKQKFDDLFIRHGSAINLIDELTEQNKYLEHNCRNEKQSNSSNKNLINLNCLMNSEKEITEDFVKKEKETQPENYTINMKVNLKKINKNSLSHINLNSRRSMNLPNHNFNMRNERDDNLIISEEIYQKRKNEGSKKNDQNQISKLIEYDTKEDLSDNSFISNSDNANEIVSKIKTSSFLSEKSEYAIQRSFYEIIDNEKSIGDEEMESENNTNTNGKTMQNLINKSIEFNSKNNKYTNGLNIYLEEQDYNTRKTTSFYGTSNNSNLTKNEINECYLEPRNMKKTVNMLSREEFLTCKNEVDYLFNQYETPNSNKINVSNVLDNTNVYNPTLITENYNNESDYNSQILNTDMKFYESNKGDNYLESNKIENENFLSNKFDTNLNRNNVSELNLDNSNIMYQQTEKSEYENRKFTSNNVITENDNYNSDSNLDLIQGINIKSQVDSNNSEYSDPQ